MGVRAKRQETAAQRYRQRSRMPGSGRYTEHNRCDCCGKKAGHDYFSSEKWCGLEGRGVVLCGKCAERLDGCDTREAALAVFAAADAKKGAKA